MEVLTAQGSFNVFGVQTPRGVFQVEVNGINKNAYVEWQSADLDGNGRSDFERLNQGLELDDLRALRKAITAAIRHLEDAGDE